MNNIPLCLYTTFCFFTHSLRNTRVSPFCLLPKPLLWTWVSHCLFFLFIKKWWGSSIVFLVCRGVVLEGLVGLYRIVQLQLLQYYWLGHRLWLLWFWMVCLGNEQRLFCHFWDYTQILHFRLFNWLWWLLHFS